MGEAVCDLIDHLGTSAHNVAGFREANRHLRKAQRQLVTSILGKHTLSPGACPIAWLNTYVELDEELAPLLRRIGALRSKADRIADLFLAAPTAILPRDQAEVDSKHRALWHSLGEGKGVLPEWSLTRQLHLLSRHPGRIDFDLQNEKLVADTRNVTINPAARELFDGAYRALLDSYCAPRYIHLALPAAASMRQMIGPAGAYILVKDVSTLPGLPQCLWSHIRSFLQSIVTAYVWSLGEDLRESVQSVAKTFAHHRNTFATFNKSAERLMGVVDPVHVDVGSFDRAQRAAAELFGNPDRHNVMQWCALLQARNSDAKREIRRFSADLKRIQTSGSRASTAAQLVKAVQEQVKCLAGEFDPTRSGKALRHAKALDHNSICLSLLDGNAKDSTIYPFGNGTRHGANLTDLHAAIVTLWKLKDLVKVESKDDCDYLVVELSSNDASSVVEDAKRILDKEDVGSLKDMTSAIAVLVRGLLNTSATSEQKLSWLNQLVDQGRGNKIRFQIDTKYEE